MNFSNKEWLEKGWKERKRRGDGEEKKACLVQKG